MGVGHRLEWKTWVEGGAALRPSPTAPPPPADHRRYVKKTNRGGKSSQPCEYYFRVFHSLCPVSWVSGRGGASPPDWARGGGPAEVSRRACLPPTPPQVQRGTEQIKNRNFAGKI